MANKNNEKKTLIVVLIIAVIVLAVISIFLFLQMGKINGDSDKPTRAWLVDNCKCVEWNGPLSCPDGYTLKNITCWKGSAYTSVLRTCSKWKCPEYFIGLNETQED